MSEQIFLRYDGPLLKGHKIDVSILAPALLSFSDLFKEANRFFNSDKAKIEVLVHADIRPNCVTLTIDIVQIISDGWSLTKSFLDNPDVVAAKTLMEWMLLPSSMAAGLFGYLMWLGVIKPKKGQTYHQVEDGDDIVVSLLEDGVVVKTIKVPKGVYQLGEDKKIVKAAQGVIQPVAAVKGIEIAVFEEPASGKKFEINKAFASEVAKVRTKEEMEIGEESLPITTHISAYGSVFSERTKKWSFQYGNHIEEIDISDTTIAHDIINRGKIVVGDTWKVRMTVTQKKTPTGYANSYKIVEVLDFIPGPEQSDFLFTRAHSLSEQNQEIEDEPQRNLVEIEF